MKRRPTKAELREEIERKVRDYLGEGGEIDQVQRGATGLQRGDFSEAQTHFAKPRQERTPLPEVVAAIEARRKPSATKKRSKLRPPRKKAIYDDFGEPVRWVWVED